MEPLFVILWVWAAMAATSYWESSVEGRDWWAKGKHGWKVRIGPVVLTQYHFFLYWIAYPVLISLPLITHGWDPVLAGILLSAYASGLIVQDFLWFVVNPLVRLRDFNPEKVTYYPWLTIGRFSIPVGYLIAFGIAVLSWLVLWR